MFCSSGSPSALSLFAPAHSHSARETHALYSELFNTRQTSSRAQVSGQHAQQRGSKTSLLSRITSASSTSSASSSSSSSSRKVTTTPTQLGIMVSREVIQCSR